MRSFASLPSHPYPPTLLLFLVFHLSVLSLSISVFSPRTTVSLSSINSYANFEMELYKLSFKGNSISYFHCLDLFLRIRQYLKTNS